MVRFLQSLELLAYETHATAQKPFEPSKENMHRTPPGNPKNTDEACYPGETSRAMKETPNYREPPRTLCKLPALLVTPITP